MSWQASSIPIGAPSLQRLLGEVTDVYYSAKWGDRCAAGEGEERRGDRYQIEDYDVQVEHYGSLR
jgi:hypothetical protein